MALASVIVNAKLQTRGRTIVEYRQLGRTPWQVSAVSFGCWAIGGDAWGNVGDSEAFGALHRAVDLGVNFFEIRRHFLEVVITDNAFDAFEAANVIRDVRF